MVHDLLIVLAPRPNDRIPADFITASGTLTIADCLTEIEGLSVRVTLRQLDQGGHDYVVGEAPVTPIAESAPPGSFFGPQSATWEVTNSQGPPLNLPDGVYALIADCLDPQGRITARVHLEPLNRNAFGGSTVTITSPNPGATVSVVFGVYGTISGTTMNVSGKITTLNGNVVQGTTVTQGPNWQINFSGPARALNATLTVTAEDNTGSASQSINIELAV